MEKRTFNIPTDSLCDEADIDDLPSYFQPGTLIKNQSTDFSPKITEDKNPSRTSYESDLNPGQSTDVTESSNKNVGSDVESSFGNAFSGLKSSKYFGGESSIQSGKGNKIASALLVNPRQRGNPLLKHIRNIPWEYDEMEPDYVMGKTTCALFLSMRYHNLYPNYIHERLKALGKSYHLRVILVQVDVIEPSLALKDLSVIAILADCTLMVSWSAEEAADYLETYKISENKSADLIKEKPFDDDFSQIIDSLTIIRSINRTDASVLLSTFGTLAKIFQASTAELAICPGIGPLKAKRLFEALRKPLMNTRKCT